MKPAVRQRLQLVRDLLLVQFGEVVEHLVIVVLQEEVAGGVLSSLPKPELGSVVGLAAHEVQAHAVTLNRNDAGIWSEFMKILEIPAM